ERRSPLPRSALGEVRRGGGGRHRPLRRVPRALPHPPRPRRRVLALRQRGWAAGADRPRRAAAQDARRGGQARPVRGGRVGRRAARPGPDLRHRDRLRHHLPRLQARPVHRLRPARGRRHRHRGDGGHLQLLRREGEDRHRPAPGPGARRGAGGRRGGRPRHHRRVRLADAVRRRRAPPHRRLQKGGQHRLRNAAPPLLRRVRHDGDRRRPRGRGAGGPRARGGRQAGEPDARRLRLRDGRHLRQAVARPRGRGDRRGRPHHRRPHGTPGRPRARDAPRRHPRPGPPVHARPVLPGGESRGRLGRDGHRGPALDHPEDRPGRRLARPPPAPDLHHRRARPLVRARRGAPARPGGDAGGRAEGGGAHRRELRAVALHRAVHGGRRRQPARRRDGEPRPAHPLRRGGRDPRHHGRRARPPLARRRHHRHGGRAAPAEERLRVGADAGDRRAGRVHLAARPLRAARRAHGGRGGDRRRAAGRRARRADRGLEPGQPVAHGAPAV
ncbi:MAG: FIG00802792: hypothetical protein, partial [uncultured Sphingomonas sp.]